MVAESRKRSRRQANLRNWGAPERVLHPQRPLRHQHAGGEDCLQARRLLCKLRDSPLFTSLLRDSRGLVRGPGDGGVGGRRMKSWGRPPGPVGAPLDEPGLGVLGW